MANMARYTFLYFAGNMAAAVLLGILLVNLICPGRGEPLAASHAAGGCEGGDRIEVCAWGRLLSPSSFNKTK
jgi:hypothetical protein